MMKTVLSLTTEVSTRNRLVSLYIVCILSVAVNFSSCPARIGDMYLHNFNINVILGSI